MEGFEFLYPLMWTFFCVLSRVGPMIVMMPPLRGSSVPMQVRAYLVIGIAAGITPLTLDNATPLPPAVLVMMIALAKELLLGMLLGGVVALLITGLQMGAQIVTSLASMELAEVADPSTHESTSVVSTFYTMMALAIFLLIGGHRALLSCCVDTFKVYPAGGVMAEEYWMLHMNNLMAHAATLGIRAAAPAAIALILSNLTTALLGRTLPQLNIMAVGFNINILVMLWVLMASIGVVGILYQNELTAWIDKTHSMLISGVADATVTPSVSPTR